jgi:formylmethanofuran dehydrogenase subunit E
MISLRLSLLALALSMPASAGAETKDEWITLGARIHGGFGPFIPVGIRIGLDAVDKLKPGPRDLVVTYYNGAKPPCPCIADGVMIATHASPGQGSLQISPEKAPEGMTAVIVIKNRKTGQGLRARGAGHALVMRTLFFLPLARQPQGLHVEARGGAAKYDQSVHGLMLEPVRSRAL